MITTMLLFFKKCFVLWYLSVGTKTRFKVFFGRHLFQKNYIWCYLTVQLFSPKLFRYLSKSLSTWCIMFRTTMPVSVSITKINIFVLMNVWKSCEDLWRNDLNQCQKVSFLNLLQIYWKQYAKYMFQLILTFCLCIEALLQVYFGSIYWY